MLRIFESFPRAVCRFHRDRKPCRGACADENTTLQGVLPRAARGARPPAYQPARAAAAFTDTRLPSPLCLQHLPSDGRGLAAGPLSRMAALLSLS